MRSKQESQLQTACIDWFKMQYPRQWEARQIHSVPNGGARNVKVAAQLKREGVRRGIWDMHITIPRGRYAGLWIEAKRDKSEGKDKGRLTKEQKEFRDAHPWYQFAEIRTVDEFVTAVNGYMDLPLNVSL